MTTKTTMGDTFSGKTLLQGNSWFRTCYTVPSAGDMNLVRVGAFRESTGHLNTICVDYFACVSDSERANWLVGARKIACELLSMDSKPATVRDWDERESALERSATLIVKTMGLAA